MSDGGVMQIVEVTDLAVRVVIVKLGRRGSALSFVVFPMIHVGSPQYYQEIRRRVARCDVIVEEGVGRSDAGDLLTLPQQAIRLNRRIGLVNQDLKLKALGIPLVRPDMSGPDFDRGWQDVPWWQRAGLRAVTPVYAMYLSMFGTREDLARHLAMDDLPTEEELRDQDSMPELADLVVDRRDALLVEALADLHEKRSTEPISVAIVYGAGHVRSVVHALNRLYGYRVRNAEFVTVFNL